MILLLYKFVKLTERSEGRNQQHTAVNLEQVKL